MRLNIRCCCHPLTIFGTVEIPESARHFHRVNLMDGGFYDLDIREFAAPTEASCKNPEKNLSFEREVCVYGDDKGIEFWVMSQFNCKTVG